MRCAVSKCKQSNSSRPIKGKVVSFYCFPKDATIRKLWVKFCDRKNTVKPNERICALHFKPEDFERNLKFEMGFSNRRAPKLKLGAVPTLDSNTNANEIKTHKCDKKKTPIITIIKEEKEDSPQVIYIKEEIEDGLQATDIKEEKEDSLQAQIKALEKKMDDLRKENDMLKMAQRQSESNKPNTSFQVQNLNLQFISFVSYNNQV